MQNNYLINFFLVWGLGMGIGDWGLGIGDWGRGNGDGAGPPIINAQFPLANLEIHIHHP